MAKERTSVTLEPDVAEEVRRDEVNTSGLVNRLLKEHFYGSGDDAAMDMLRIRRDRLEEKIESLESELRTNREMLSAVEDRLEGAKDDQNAELDKLASMLPVKESRSTGPYLDIESSRLRDHADRIGVEPERIRDRALELHEEEYDNE